MNDILENILDYIKADSDVTDLVDTRVYAGDLNRSIIEEMPKKAVVIQITGGEDKRGKKPIVRLRMEIWNFGETYYIAGQVDRAVFNAFDSLQREWVNDYLLHSAIMNAGYRQMRFGQSGWPFVIRNGTIIADDGTADD